VLEIVTGWAIKDLADRAQQSNWRVLADGIIQARMPVTLIERQHPTLTIAYVIDLIYGRVIDLDV
jgi:MOSC domain-containing protein YiiM